MVGASGVGLTKLWNCHRATADDLSAFGPDTIDLLIYGWCLYLCDREDLFVLMVTRSFELAAAFLIGANVALLFSVGLIAWKSQLDEDHIIRTEAWRALQAGERPAGEAGRRWAVNSLEELTLRFAKASSAVAIALAGTALVMQYKQA